MVLVVAGVILLVVQLINCADILLCLIVIYQTARGKAELAG